jgi:hypothetical protein
LLFWGGGSQEKYKKKFDGREENKQRKGRRGSGRGKEREREKERKRKNKEVPCMAAALPAAGAFFF